MPWKSGRGSHQKMLPAPVRIHIGHNNNLWPRHAGNVLPPFNVLVIAAFGEGRSSSTDAARDGITDRGRHRWEQAFNATLNEPLVAHPDIEGFDRVRNSTRAGTAKEVENLWRYLCNGFHRPLSENTAWYSSSKYRIYWILRRVPQCSRCSDPIRTAIEKA